MSEEVNEETKTKNETDVAETCAAETCAAEETACDVAAEECAAEAEACVCDEKACADAMGAGDEMRDDTVRNEEVAAEESVKRNGLFARFGAWCKGKISAFKSAVEERGEEIEHAKKKRIFAGIGICLFVVFLIVFYALVGVTIVGFVKDPEGFKEWIDGFDGGSVAIFIGLRVLMTVFRVIPGGPLQIAGGYAFGTWWGALWCMVGSLIGTLIIFLLGKKFGTKLVGLFISPQKMKSGGMIKDKRKRNVFLFLMNFLPGTPKDIFTWVAAISDDGAISSVLVILLARIPSLVVSTWCGHALMQENYLLSAIVFGILLVVGLVCSYGYKKYTAKKDAKEAQENAQTDENGEQGE